MPANLPPQYFEVEKKLKTATTPEEKIEIYEELLSIIPKHKGTEKIQAQLKTRMAKLRSEAKRKPTTAHHGPAHGIRRSGAGQLIVIGPPNAGKSLLIKNLTDTDLQVGDYPFTTTSAIPAMMKFENIQIQLVDTPPITPEYMEIWIPELIKTSDGILMVLDLSALEPAGTLQAVVSRLEEKKIKLSGKNTPDHPNQKIFFKKAIIVANKSEVSSSGGNLSKISESLTPEIQVAAVSARNMMGLPELKKTIFQLLEIIRVYSKTPGGKAETENPFTLKRGSTVLDMARAVHKDFSQKLKFARIWGKNTYDGQKVKRDHILEDGDIIELHM